MGPGAFRFQSCQTRLAQASSVTVPKKIGPFDGVCEDLAATHSFQHSSVESAFMVTGLGLPAIFAIIRL